MLHSALCMLQSALLCAVWACCDSPALQLCSRTLPPHAAFLTPTHPYPLYPHPYPPYPLDPPLNPKKNREQMVGTMFETYGFQGVFIQVQAVLTLYAQGLMTGLVIDSGDGVTHVVPVVDGFAFPHLTKRLNVAGRHITTHMVDLLLRRGYAFNRSADMDTVRQVKESLCFVSYDYARDLKLARETTVLVKSYTLPDGRVIKVRG